MYASPEDLILKYGESNLASITNEDPNNDIADRPRLTLALEEATAEIDSYLGKCYVTPLPIVPAVIRFKAIALARYHLESGCNCSEVVQKNYDAILEWLKELCCGDCPPDLGLVRRQGRRDSVTYTTNKRVFTRSGLVGYVDSEFGYADRNYNTRR